MLSAVVKLCVSSVLLEKRKKLGIMWFLGDQVPGICWAVRYVN